MEPSTSVNKKLTAPLGFAEALRRSESVARDVGDRGLTALRALPKDVTQVARRTVIPANTRGGRYRARTSGLCRAKERDVLSRTLCSHRLSGPLPRSN